ncbi:MAG: glycosyltransferase family 4 protein [Candidatus Sericytochromatia bacterium]
MNLKAWLIGPLEQDPLDLALQASFPEARFFRQGDSISLRCREAPTEGILLLDPLNRLLPEDIWEPTQRRIGLCPTPLGQMPHPVKALLNALDGVIPLEADLGRWLPPELPRSAPVWILGPGHFTAPAEKLYPFACVLNRAWHPMLQRSEAQTPRPVYFIHTNPSRLPFYFRRQALTLMPAEAGSLPLQVLACGGRLLVADADKWPFPSLPEGRGWQAWQADTPLQAQQLLTAPLPSAEAAALRALSLEHTLPEALEALCAHPVRPRLLSALQLSTQQLALLPQPHALNRLQPLLAHMPSGRERQALERLFYLRVRSSPYSETDPVWLEQQVAGFNQLLPAGPENTLFALQLSLLQAQHTQSLQAASALLDQQVTRQDLHSPVCCGSEPVYRELENCDPEGDPLPRWLSWIRLLSLAHLGELETARQELEVLLAQGPFPSGLMLWRVLNAESAPLTAWAQRRAEHPQNLELAISWLEQLARQAPGEALHASEELLDLCQRYLNRTQEQEKILALRQRLLAAPPSAEVQVLWEGPLYTHSSLAGINRRWMLKLQADPGFEVTHLPYEPPEHAPDEETASLRKLPAHAPDIFVSHRWPPREQAPVAGRWLSILPWEFGVIPLSWVERLNHAQDQVWVPSQFVADGFVRSGVRRTQIRVIPNGVDTTLLTPEGPTLPLNTAKNIRLLFVGGLIDRKGVDLLLRAYHQAFRAHDDVTLLLKAFGGQSHYAMQSFDHLLRELQASPDAPEVQMLDADLSPAELAALYRSCQLYVHPYRGEGFAMPILEAMACGLPVVIPDAGPAPEFCPPEAGWRVPTRVRFESHRDVQGLGLAIGPPHYSETDVTELARILREAVAQPEQRQQRGQQGRLAALAYDWNALYPQVSTHLQALAAQPFAHRERAAWIAEQLQSNTLAEVIATCPEAPEVLVAAFHRLSRSDWLALWQRALSQGLPLDSAWQLASSQQDLPLWTGLPLLISSWSEQATPLRALASSARITVQPSGAGGDLSLGFGAPAQVVYLTESTLPSLAPAREIWYAHPELKEPLLAQGFAPEQLLYLPLGLDFDLFHPGVPATVLEESLDRFVFLSIFDWEREGGWQTLMQAYLQAFEEADPVNLVLKPHGADFDSMLNALMDWLVAAGHDPEHIPSLTFVQEDLSLEQLPGLYRGADCFVTAQSAGAGIWALAAQACERPVISCGHFPFLQAPLGAVFTPGDVDHLAWLLRAHWQDPRPANQPVVRAYLEREHAGPVWQRQAEERLIRRALIDRAERLREGL